MEFFIQRIIVLMGGVVEEKVECHINTNHIANVEVTHDRNGERDDEQLVLSVFDQLFDGIGQNGEPDHGVDPHGVVLLYHRVGTEGVHGGKDADLYLALVPRGFVKIPTEGQTAKAGFEEEDDQKRFQYPPLGEEGNQPRQRACDIVGVDAQEFTAKRPREGVEKTGVAPDKVAECLVKIDVLPVEVKHQNAAVRDRVKSAADVDQEHQPRRNQKARGEMGVLTVSDMAEESAKAHCDGRLFCRFIGDGLVVHGFRLPFRRVFLRCYLANGFFQLFARYGHVTPAAKALDANITAHAKDCEFPRAAGMGLFQLQNIV